MVFRILLKKTSAVLYSTHITFWYFRMTHVTMIVFDLYWLAVAYLLPV